jgi:precorrin-2 dehydrogenase / sirohydrochlorin ferrochelatase
MASLFPIFLKLQDKKCLLVGAGPVAAQKLSGLINAGAEIHVVAPQAVDRVQALAQEGRVRWSQREFESSDLDGVVLVVVATGDPETNERIYRKAELRGVLCNAVDEPERCHFYYPAVVQRGDLQIAISTAGHSPALAQRIRKELEEEYDAGYAEWLRWLGELRLRLFAGKMDPEQRRNLLHKVARREEYQRFSRSKAKQAGAAR